MDKVTLSVGSLIPGEPLSVSVFGVPHEDYGQLQVDIVTAGVPNPSFAVSTGTQFELLQDRGAQIDIPTDSLQPGFYEIGLIRLHSPTREGIPQQVDYLSGRNFPRQCLHVRSADSSPMAPAEVLQAVTAMEAELEQSFLEPVNLLSGEEDGDEFWSLVFVKDVLLGNGMRLGKFEIVPTGSGLDGQDGLRFVNEFLAKRTKTDLHFQLDEGEQEQARRSTPVAVLYFPSVQAINERDVLRYCTEQAETLLLALALSRDAGGVVFDVVIGSKTRDKAHRYSAPRPYKGNLLTGAFAGEQAQQVEPYIQGLRNSSFDRFLAGLYREARREPSRDFQYVRFWQILELMADSRNFDPEAFLLDDDGHPFRTDGQSRRLKGAVATVCEMLRQESYGKTSQNWRSVNIWFAFRSAVAHYGQIRHYDMLSRTSTRRWAEEGVEEIRQGNHDQFLWQLKEAAKFLLMKRLVRAADASTSNEPNSREAASST